MLSIVIPVYNTEKYLRRCFDSVLNEKIRIIIVNDGSTDHSQQIIDEYCNHYPNFESITISNSGPAAARKVGLSKVKTKYFAFVDSDDYIIINDYINLCEKLDELDLKIGINRIYLTLLDNKIKLKSRIWRPQIIDYAKEKEKLPMDISILNNKIYHSDIIPLFEDNKLKAYEDTSISYGISAITRYAYHTNIAPYYYCMRNDSTFFNVINPYSSNGLNVLYTSCIKRREFFARYGLLEYYKEELDAIDIQLFFQRIKSMYEKKDIQNKDELAKIIVCLLKEIVPDFQNNRYYKIYFYKNELNDFYNFLLARFKLPSNFTEWQSSLSVSELLDNYDQKLVLKK